MKRRAFIAAAALSTGFGWWPPIFAAAPSKQTARLLPLDTGISFDTLNAYVGQSFSVYGSTGVGFVVKLTLTSLDNRRLSSETDQFSARFRGSTSSPLESGVYSFEHASSGQFRLLIEPIGTSAKGADYRADFNLLLP